MDAAVVATLNQAQYWCSCAQINNKVVTSVLATAAVYANGQFIAVKFSAALISF